METKITQLHPFHLKINNMCYFLAAVLILLGIIYIAYLTIKKGSNEETQKGAEEW